MEKDEFAKAMSKATGKSLDSFKNLTADKIQATLNDGKNFIAGMTADEFDNLSGDEKIEREESFGLALDCLFPIRKN